MRSDRVGGRAFGDVALSSLASFTYVSEGPAEGCKPTKSEERQGEWGRGPDVGKVASEGVVHWGDWPEIVVADLTVAPGNSGGPVFGPDGRVVGVTVGWLPGTGFSAFVPLRRLCQFLDLGPYAPKVIDSGS